VPGLLLVALAQQGDPLVGPTGQRLFEVIGQYDVRDFVRDLVGQ
jgi:hypothetical protein